MKHNINEESLLFKMHGMCTRIDLKCFFVGIGLLFIGMLIPDSLALTASQEDEVKKIIKAIMYLLKIILFFLILFSGPIIVRVADIIKDRRIARQRGE